jgi:hypothetical protein
VDFRQVWGKWAQDNLYALTPIAAMVACCAGVWDRAARKRLTLAKRWEDFDAQVYALEAPSRAAAKAAAEAQAKEEERKWREETKPAMDRVLAEMRARQARLRAELNEEIQREDQRLDAEMDGPDQSLAQKQRVLERSYLRALRHLPLWEIKLAKFYEEYTQSIGKRGGGPRYDSAWHAHQCPDIAPGEGGSGRVHYKRLPK